MVGLDAIENDEGRREKERREEGRGEERKRVVGGEEEKGERGMKGEE